MDDDDVDERVHTLAVATHALHGIPDMVDGDERRLNDVTEMNRDDNVKKSNLDCCCCCCYRRRHHFLTRPHHRSSVPCTETHHDDEMGP